MMLRLPNKMLATPESDFEPNVVDGIRKAGARVPAGFELQFELRKQISEQVLLVRGQLRPLAAAVKHSSRAFGVLSHPSRLRRVNRGVAPQDDEVASCRGALRRNAPKHASSEATPERVGEIGL